MKTWTVVIEIETDTRLKNEIEDWVSENLSFSGFPFRIMETIEAPYGPQHKDGVWIAERGATQPESYTLGRAGRIKS